MILAIISNAIKIRTTLALGAPHSRRSKEFVHLEKAGVECGYHHEEMDRFKNSMALYQIHFEDIRNIEYDAKCMLLTITGVAQLTAYDDFTTKRINYSLSQRRFYPDSNFSFILATHDAEKIISEIKGKIDHKLYCG